MNILLDNINLQSSSGPNSFAQKLSKYLSKKGHSLSLGNRPFADIRLCFIESRMKPSDIPLVTRLDGIYFNTTADFQKQNANIFKTYNNSNGIIFQSHFNKELTTRYFGPHKNTQIIHNGADTELIEKTSAHSLAVEGDVWCCASSWRPHKRLKENIRYFLEHSGANDILIVAGKVGNISEDLSKDKKIMYVGNLSYEQLLSVYKSSKYFIHLSWLDHCPNVVVDARASGCQIICSSTGGTKEIAGKDAIIIKEEEWDFMPINLYDPPILNFNNKIDNKWDIDYTMDYCSSQYEEYLSSNLK